MPGRGEAKSPDVWVAPYELPTTIEGIKATERNRISTLVTVEMGILGAMRGFEFRSVDLKFGFFAAIQKNRFPGVVSMSFGKNLD